MKEDMILTEKIRLLEKEIVTLSDRQSGYDSILKEIKDLKLELRGLKLFLGRHHPELKKELPEIVEKLRAGRTE
ncbi:MAG: hypothetical protein M0Z59_08250 [Nitrospiraceae bacterium]|nr:hypothetical protein [Nitrospiraceae bacterium]